MKLKPKTPLKINSRKYKIGNREFIELPPGRRVIISGGIKIEIHIPYYLQFTNSFRDNLLYVFATLEPYEYGMPMVKIHIPNTDGEGSICLGQSPYGYSLEELVCIFWNTSFSSYSGNFYFNLTPENTIIFDRHGNTKANFDGRYIVYKNAKGRPHKENGPAQIAIDVNMKRREIKYCLRGRLHREDGAAHIVTSSGGTRMVYYLEGIIYPWWIFWTKRFVSKLFGKNKCETPQRLPPLSSL